MNPPKIRQYAPRIVMLQWELEPGKSTSEWIWQWDAYLKEHYRDQLVETVIAYCEIALYIRPGIPVQALIEKLERVDLQTAMTIQEQPQQITLPVCYGGRFGPDLDEVAAGLGLTATELIERHSQGDYQAAFLGFLPGFAYLNGLDAGLHYPRKDRARPLVKAGSVGIGGRQTGIYPMDSPGGWQVIGRCPIPLFDRLKKPAALIQAGALVRFRPISEAEYDLLTIEVSTETFQYQKLAHD